MRTRPHEIFGAEEIPELADDVADDRATWRDWLIVAVLAFAVGSGLGVGLGLVARMLP